MAEAKVCFVICPIDEEGSATRRRADNVLDYIVKPAAKPRGYEVIRADRIAKPGHITMQIVEHLRDDALVIADLTEHNPNVFYELALRHAVRKPIIHMTDTDPKWRPPFDIAQQRTIFFDATDLGSAEEAKAEIGRQIEAIEKNPSNFDNPVSLAIELLTMRESGQPEQARYVEMAITLHELYNMVERIEQRLTLRKSPLLALALDKFGTLAGMATGEPRSFVTDQTPGTMVDPGTPKTR